MIVLARLAYHLSNERGRNIREMRKKERRKGGGGGMGSLLCGAGWQLWVGQEGGWSFGRRRFGWCGAWCLAVFARVFADEIAQS